MTDTHNPACPDYSSHYENAVERLFPGLAGARLTTEQDEAACAEADAEYLACEGH